LGGLGEICPAGKPVSTTPKTRAGKILHLDSLHYAWYVDNQQKNSITAEFDLNFFEIWREGLNHRKDLQIIFASNLKGWSRKIVVRGAGSLQFCHFPQAQARPGFS
jgi:hypothetical protein